MKKNLKIVSAAAAALLAVAPVVATGVASSPVVSAATDYSEGQGLIVKENNVYVYQRDTSTGSTFHRSGSTVLSKGTVLTANGGNTVSGTIPTEHNYKADFVPIKIGTGIYYVSAAQVVSASSLISTDNNSSNGSVNKATDVGPIKPIANKADVNVTPHVTLNTSVPGTDLKGALSASFDVKANDTTATSILTPNVSSVQLFWTNPADSTDTQEITDLSQVTNGTAGATYYVQLNGVGLNFGSKNAGKKITLTFPEGDAFKESASDNWTNSAEVTLSNTGTITLDKVALKVTAKDYANPAVVNWHDDETGAVVNHGDVRLYAGSDAGRMNVKEVLAKIQNKYYAENSIRPQSTKFDYTSESDLTKQLEAQGMKVDENGWFVASKKFNVSYKATANNNDASSTLNVTVHVPNGKDISAPDEYAHTTRVWNRKASYLYNENHERVAHNLMYKIGSGHNVVADANGSAKEYTIAGGVKAYKLADGHYKGDYVDVRNFSNHRVSSNKKVVTTRARVFTASGRVVGRHNYVNAGVRVKISGTKTIKGHKMYRIATNRYIKAANVRNA